MSEKKIRIGIIGIGNMGSYHAKGIKDGKCPGIELTAVADFEPKRLEWAVNNLPGTVAKFETAEEMLDSGLIDAAIVAVPHYDHPKYAVACFERGLHVMVEKPAGVYTRQVREMNSAAKKANVVFGMMFNQRTDHIYRKMHDMVHSGELGAMRRSTWIITSWYRSQSYYNSGGWRATWAGEGGGVLLNQCPHNLDLWQWICGLPVSVYTKMHFGKWHDIEVEDDVTSYVEYANGATGVFITTTGEYPGTNRFEITMDKGKLLAEDGKLFLWKLEQSEGEFSAINQKAFAHPEAEYTQVETDGKSEQHFGVLNAFANAILRGEPLIAEGEEGINGLMLSNAMHLSAWQGKEIALPFDENLFYDELMNRVNSSREKQIFDDVISELEGSYNIARSAIR